jgi:hypothetical protein
MTELDPNFLQVSFGEVGQHILIDCIFRERGRVFAKTNLL